MDWSYTTLESTPDFGVWHGERGQANVSVSCSLVCVLRRPRQYSANLTSRSNANGHLPRDQAGGLDGVSPVLSAMLHRRDSNERASARIELVAPISLFVLFRCLSKSRARCRALATVPAGHRLPAADTFFRFNVLIDCRFISKRNALRRPGRRVAFHPDHPGVSPLSGSILAPTSQTAWAPLIPSPPSRTSCGHRPKQAIGRPSQTVLECTDSSQDTNIRSTADEPSGSSRSAIHSQGDLRVAAWLRLSGDRGGAC